MQSLQKESINELTIGMNCTRSGEKNASESPSHSTPKTKRNSATGSLGQVIAEEHCHQDHVGGPKQTVRHNPAISECQNWDILYFHFGQTILADIAHRGGLACDDPLEETVQVWGTNSFVVRLRLSLCCPIAYDYGDWYETGI
jgi:hypothetical protein